MKLFRFDSTCGKKVDAFGSENFVYSRVIRGEPQSIQVGCAHLEPNGLIGYHQATCPQLLLVVAGKGWVRSGEGERTPIEAGQAVYWEEGEWHETGTEAGLMGIIIEANELDPSGMLPV